MILEYHRPTNPEEAYALMQRTEPPTYALAGGSQLVKNHTGNIAVVDLQDLGWDAIDMEGNILLAGATVRLSDLVHSDSCPAALKDAILRDVSENQRNQGTLGGSIVSGDGRSTLLTALLAMDARLRWQPEDEETAIGNYLPLRGHWNRSRLLQRVKVPTSAKLSFETVARTPADRPVLIVAIAQWPSGRTRVALGGTGQAPILALDGPDATGAAFAARDAYLEAGDDWASAAYRSQTAFALANHLLKKGN